MARKMKSPISRILINLSLLHFTAQNLNIRELEKSNQQEQDAKGKF
jgi:hypothetical protein